MFGQKKRCSCDTAKSVANNTQMPGQPSAPQYDVTEINELRRMLNALCDHFGVAIVHENGYKVYKQSDLGGPLFGLGKPKRKK